MKKEDFDKGTKNGKIEVIVPKPFEAEKVPTTQPPSKTEQEFASILLALRTVRQPVSVVPTNVPKNFLQQIEIYESGATRRLYIYVNGTWRYVALT